MLKGKKVSFLKWKYIPDKMKNKSVEVYYNILVKKYVSILIKRILDFVASILIIIILLPLIIIISILVKIDSEGPIIFRQTRITQYCKEFKIYKFRTMINNAEKMGSNISTYNDTRVTKIGKILRKYKLDELPQLINILIGDMSFVGTRPELPKYYEKYTEEMLATLLLPAGVTSQASIKYKNEEKLLNDSNNVDEVYEKLILPDKMNYNLASLKNFSLLSDFITIIETILVIFIKDTAVFVSEKRIKKQ